MNRDSIDHQTETNPRYLICRPWGGLNDTLCRIEACWRYAEKFDRRLIIDTKNSALFDDFDKYFRAIDKTVSVTGSLSDALLHHLKTLPYEPETIQGRVDTSRAVFARRKGFDDLGSQNSHQFAPESLRRLNEDSPEPVLVYENTGGGTLSHNLFNRIQLLDDVSEQIVTSLKTLRWPYVAVHVRNTDYQSNYRLFFKKIRKSVGDQRLLVCSDDPGVIEYALDYFPGEVMSFSGRARSAHPSGALHQRGAFTDKDARRTSVIDSLTDLIALGCAQHLYIGTVSAVFDVFAQRERGMLKWNSIDGISGFSKLAGHLCQNPQKVKALLNHPLPFAEAENKDVTLVDLEPIRHKLLKKAQVLFNQLRRQ